MEQRDLASLGVLGVLAEVDMATVHQIHETLKHNFGRYWGASTGIILPTLSQLEEAGQVGMTVADGARGYTITETGRDRLNVLLKEPVEDVSNPSFRPHLMMKLGFLYHLSSGDQHKEISEMQAQLREERDRVRTLQLSHDDEPSDPMATGYRGELLDLRIRIINAILDWFEIIK